jgi:hypothetical protein
VTSPTAERLSAAHLAWLKEFSVVMQRRYAYPPGHPSRVAAEATALQVISGALQVHHEIGIAVTQRQLVINGVASDPRNPAIGELSERLHRQGIANITLREGVSGMEFERLLDRITTAKPPGPDEEDDAPDHAPIGVHVGLEMLRYDGLALQDEDDEAGGPDATGERLWRELADAALEGWDGLDGADSGGGVTDEARDSAPVTAAEVAAAEAAPPPRPSVAMRQTRELPAALSAANIAKMISARAGEPGAAGDILKSLLRVGRHARRRGRAGSGAVAQRLREVLSGLEPGTLQTLLDSEVDPVRKRLLLMQGVDALPVSVVTEWIEAAAASGKESISTNLLRLFKKLAAQTRRRRDTAADDGGEAIREAARQLIEGWTYDATGAEPHGELLAKIAAYDTDEAALEGGGTAGADRIVQIALETNVAATGDVMAAVDQLIDEKRLALLFRFVDEAETATVTQPAILGHLLVPETVRRVLLTEPVDPDGAHLLLERCDMTRADALLDALAISESEATRRMILERLRALGEAIRDPILFRIPGALWYVQRNLLSLLGDMPDPPRNLPFDEFLASDEPMLRLEAIRLLMRIPERREGAVHDALGDADPRVMRAGLEAAANGLGRRSYGRLLQILEQAGDAADIRLRGIPLLRHVPLPAARDWLLTLVRRRRGAFMFRRWVLAPRSAEMLAALRVLAQRWAADPAVVGLLKLGAKSDDAAIVAAAAGREAA